MRGNTQNIPNQTKQQIRRDYALGKGGISSLARAYNVSRARVAKWAESEKWVSIKDSFARHDDLIVAKQQLVQLDGLIEQESEPEAMLQWFKCKQAAFEIFATIAGLPRRPIGKLEKPKGNDLAKMLEQIASENKEPEKPAEASIEVETVDTPLPAVQQNGNIKP